MEQRTCLDCQAPLTKVRPGRWPKRCERCRHREPRDRGVCVVAFPECAKCNQVFCRGRSHAIYCSRTCARRTVSVVYFPSCAVCSRVFTARRSDVIYCSIPCNSKADCERGVAAGRWRKAPTNWCDCGKVIRVTAATCKPCGEVKRLSDERRKARRRAATRKLARAARGVPANPRWPWVQGECATCGETFIRKGGASRYCSRECNPKRRNGTGKFISRKGRLAIYERDGYVCQLCMEPVDRDLMTLDPMSDWAPSLDHIVCRTERIDHSPKNLRLTHRWCNSVRGNETYYTADALRPVA